MTDSDLPEPLPEEVSARTEKTGDLPGIKLLKLIPYLGILLIGLVSGYFLGVNQRSSTPASKPENIEENSLTQYLMDDDPILGSEDALITIIEFGDYECPFCKQWHEEIWPQLQTTYPQMIRLVYRDFPLVGLHENAVPAAEAANCAGAQGKYWEYHDLLFQNQSSLSEEQYTVLAGELGLSISEFTTCLTNQTYATEVEADFQEAITFGLTGTPTFFINGYRVEGVPSIDDFQGIIENILALEAQNQ